MNLVSATTFTWFMSILTGGFAGTWLIYDAYSMWRARTADRRDPIVRDKLFGYAIGMLIGLIGVLGVLKHHLA